MLLKLDKLTGIPNPQAKKKGAPWTETSVYHSYCLPLKLDKLGFQPSKQEREELPGLILHSMIVITNTIKTK